MNAKAVAIVGCVSAAFLLGVCIYAGVKYWQQRRRALLPCAAGSMFDTILYINLQSRADRLVEIQDVLRKVGWLAGSQRIDAVRDATNGALGCLRSHIKALEVFLAMPASVRHALILEDDCEFVVDPKPGVQQFLADHGCMGWDVLLLSSNTLAEEPHTLYATRVQNAQTTAGYAVTRRFAAVLLALWKESLSKPFLECDQSWKPLQAPNRWFCLHPKPGRQRESYSDIELRSVNYGV